MVVCRFELTIFALKRLESPLTVSVVMLAAFVTLIVATFAYWMLVVCRFELTIFALKRLESPLTVRVVMLAAFVTLIVATFAYWILVVCRLELTMFACCRLLRPLTVRVVTFAPVNTLIVAIFINERTFMNDILVETPSKFVTLIVLETKTLPTTLRERTGAVVPTLATWRKAFAK